MERKKIPQVVCELLSQNFLKAHKVAANLHPATMNIISDKLIQTLIEELLRGNNPKLLYQNQIFDNLF
jgi:hypothetical protein